MFRFLAGVMLFLIVPVFHQSALFAACSGTPSGDLPGWGSTVTLSSCNKTISAVTGVDYATSETSTANSSTLSLSGTSSLTINTGGKLIVGSLTLGSGTSISMASGAEIKTRSPIYINDADGDGWASTAINAATLSTATGSGKRRLTFMRSYTADCSDAAYNQANSCCTVATRYRDADGDGYGNPLVTISACTTAGYVDNNSDCNDTGTNSANVSTAATCYTDADNDNYGTGSSKTCITQGATCTTATWASGGAGTAAASGNFASNNTDCNDTGTSSSNVYISATCYVDADNDNYGSITTKTCTNNATCGSATWASGGAGTAAASGNFASNNTDCHETGTNAALVWSSTTCYSDVDNDNYTNGAQTCTNNAVCASATNGSTGNDTTVVAYTAGNLQSTTGAGNTDCYDADAATTNAELAYPGSTTCSTASRGDGSFDYDCSGTGTRCSTLLSGSNAYTTIGTNWGCNENNGTCQNPSSYMNYYPLSTAATCGATGYYCTGTSAAFYSCSQGGGTCSVNYYPSFCTSLGTSTQACQ